MNAAATTKGMLATKEEMLERQNVTIAQKGDLEVRRNDESKQREELIVQLRCEIKLLTDINTDLEDKLSEKFEKLSG